MTELNLNLSLFRWAQFKYFLNKKELEFNLLENYAPFISEIMPHLHYPLKLNPSFWQDSTVPMMEVILYYNRIFSKLSRVVRKDLKPFGFTAVSRLKAFLENDDSIQIKNPLVQWVPSLKSKKVTRFTENFT